MVVLDFAGFEKASEIVGGVPVTLTRPETLDGKRYEAGDQHLQGEAALEYVRQRYGLPRGDFDRVSASRTSCAASSTGSATSARMTRSR